jgi:mannose-6-phosphate isomerase-like protein (cupin superfamily)
MKLVSAFAIVLLATPAFAQTKGKSEVFRANDIKEKLTILEQTAKVSGSGGAKLGDYGSHSIALSVRDSSGGAEIHAHYDDIFLVTQGKATLITGGTVVDAKTGADGETKGSKVQGGAAQTISVGDVVHIPAGTPHQLIVAPGVTYSCIVIKVREG